MSEARDEASGAIRGLLYRMGRAAGVTFTEQPIFEGAKTTEQVMDPAAAIGMCLILRDAVKQRLEMSIRQARAAGLTWAQVGEALHLKADDSGNSPGELAYEYATDAKNARPFDRWSFYYTCSACAKHVTDHGPYNGHPIDNETGHADDCARLTAAIAEYNARWEDDE